MEYHKLPEHIEHLKAKLVKARELYSEVAHYALASMDGKVGVTLRASGCYGNCCISGEALRELVHAEIAELEQKLSSAEEQHEVLKKVAVGLIK